MLAKSTIFVRNEAEMKPEQKTLRDGRERLEYRGRFVLSVLVAGLSNLSEIFQIFLLNLLIGLFYLILISPIIHVWFISLLYAHLTSSELA